MAKANHKMVVFSTLDNSGKGGQSISILKTKILTFGTKGVDIAMIDADTYRIACRLKKARIFAIFMKDLECQVQKETKQETNLENIISEEYLDFLNIFYKKNLDTLLSH